MDRKGSHGIACSDHMFVCMFVFSNIRVSARALVQRARRCDSWCTLKPLSAYHAAADIDHVLRPACRVSLPIVNLNAISIFKPRAKNASPPYLRSQSGECPTEFTVPRCARRCLKIYFVRLENCSLNVRDKVTDCDFRVRKALDLCSLTYRFFGYPCFLFLLL